MSEDSPEISQATEDSSSFVSTEPSWSRSPKTITLKLDDDGNLKPLSERMQSRMREFASREDWQTATGLREGKSDGVTTAEDKNSPGVELLDEAKAKHILKWMEQTKQMLWGMLGLSEAKRTEICHYSKEQSELIAPPLATVINKRSPDWMKKYWPEIQLAMFMGTIEIGQFQTCAKTLMEERKSKSGRPTLVREAPQAIREPRTVERKEPVASAEARTEVQKSSEFCQMNGCAEPSVPGVGYCRIHRSMEAAEA